MCSTLCCRRLRRSGATLALDDRLTSLEPTRTAFNSSPRMAYCMADRVIVTTGGKSYPGCGTTGDGYGWAQGAGTHDHSTPPRVDSGDQFRKLDRGTARDHAARMWKCKSSKSAATERLATLAVHARRRGSFLFAHFGLSGPAPLDVSRAISGHSNPKALQLLCDFLPMHDRTNNWERRSNANVRPAADANWQTSSVCGFPRRLAESLIQRAGLRVDQRVRN